MAVITTDHTEDQDGMRRNTTGRGRRLRTLAAALLLAALAAIPSSGTAIAQEPPEGEGILLVNADDEDLVERKKDGRFIARPVFDQELPALYYGVRDGDTGEWIAPMYRVRGDAKERRDGWEYSFEYPFEDGQTELDPERPYLLVIIARSWAEETRPFYAVIPPHQPGGLWNRVLGALDPERWGRAIAAWVIEGAHGMLCGVVERASGGDADACEVTP